MADKQISQLTETTSPSTTDLYVCQQSNGARRITLDNLRAFILKIAGLSSSISSNLTGSEYLLLDQNNTPKKITLDAFMNTRLQQNTTISDSDYFPMHSNNYPRKVTAATLKSYCGGGSGGGIYYASYGSASFSSIESAYLAGKVIYCIYNSTVWCPVVEFNGSTFKFYDTVNDYFCTVDRSDNWSRTAR